MGKAAKLSDFASVNPATDTNGVATDAPVAFIPMAAVAEGGGWHATEHRPLSDGRKGYTLFQRGDVIVAKITPCFENGKVALLSALETEFGLGSTEFHVLRAKSGHDPRFIYHWTRHPAFLRAGEASMTGSAGQRRVPAGFFERFEIPRIEGPSQTRIADILDALDDAILEADALIEKHEAVRLGLLDDLIATPAQVGRSQAPDKLADVVASISSGCSVNADDRPPTAGEFGVLKTSAVGGGRFRPAESKAVWTREIGRLKCPVVAGLILFSRMNTPQLVGENAFVEHDHPDLFLPDRLWAIRVREGESVLAAWVATILQTRQARSFITGEATGTSGSMKNIAQKSLLRLPIRKLPESDQADAVKAIAALQAEIDELTAERDKLADLRLGLRDDLLSGRKPVAASREAAE
jgi:type I restriction enzyme S subunit